MKYILAVLVLLGWYAAVGFTSWLLYRHGHPVWAAVVALLGARSVSLKDFTP